MEVPSIFELSWQLQVESRQTRWMGMMPVHIAVFPLMCVMRTPYACVCACVRVNGGCLSFSTSAQRSNGSGNPRKLIGY